MLDTKIIIVIGVCTFMLGMTVGLYLAIQYTINRTIRKIITYFFNKYKSKDKVEYEFERYMNTKSKTYKELGI